MYNNAELHNKDLQMEETLNQLSMKFVLGPCVGNFLETNEALNRLLAKLSSTLSKWWGTKLAIAGYVSKARKV